MPDAQSSPAGSRSEKRIPSLRTRGRANRKKLLAVAQQLIEEHDGRPIRFSEVFEAADVSRGSAYRIYNGLEDLMQDLASSWINNFVAYVKHEAPITQPGSWVELSDHLVARAAAYWVETADTLRREGCISEKRLAEAQNICNTYLSFSLPTQLPVRDSNS